MDWNTIIPVVIGGLIATIPILISNKFQARERDRDRAETRKEAKTQLALELMRKDVGIVEDAINSALTSLNFSRSLAYKRNIGKLTDEEMFEELSSTLAADTDTFQVNYIVDKVAFTFGDDFFSHYKSWENLVGIYFGVKLFPSPEVNEEELEELWNKIVSASATLHTMLREKLVSARE